MWRLPKRPQTSRDVVRNPLWSPIALWTVLSWKGLRVSVATLALCQHLNAILAESQPHSSYLSPYVTPILRASATLYCLSPSLYLFDVAISCPDLQCLGQFSIFILPFCRFTSVFSLQPEPQNDTMVQNSKLAHSKAGLETWVTAQWCGYWVLGLQRDAHVLTGCIFIDSR